MDLKLKQSTFNDDTIINFTEEEIQSEAKKFSKEIVSEFMNDYKVSEIQARKSLAEIYLYQYKYNK